MGRIVTAIVASRTDPRTIEDWGRIVNAAKPTIDNWCRVAKLSSKASLDFARVLRALVQGQRLNWRPEDLLCGDHRTIERLMVRAGLDGVDPSNHLELIAYFLAKQTFIQNPRAVQLIADRLLHFHSRGQSVP